MKYAVESKFSGHPEFKAIRLSYVFSRDDRFTRYLAGCAERNETAEVFHPFSRAVVHRDDVIAGALALARDWDAFPQPAINFGGPQLLSRLDFARILQETMLPALRYAAAEPPAAFFANRPRIVAMQSPLLPRLLGRPQHSMLEAAILEAKGALAP
jgi:dTDP-4-dehydrorhamnose reductase